MKTLFLIFLAVPLMAAGPKHNFEDSALNDEFENVYFDIGKIPQFIDLYSMTKSQIALLIPKRVGRLYFCSDCTTDAVCVSTGTTIASFSRLTARTTACQ